MRLPMFDVMNGVYDTGDRILKQAKINQDIIQDIFRRSNHLNFKPNTNSPKSLIFVKRRKIDFLLPRLKEFERIGLKHSHIETWKMHQMIFEQIRMIHDTQDLVQYLSHYSQLFLVGLTILFVNEIVYKKCVYL